MIRTLEGNHAAFIGDWIIKGVKGEFYPCKPDIFEMTYDPCSGAVLSSTRRAGFRTSTTTTGGKIVNVFDYDSQLSDNACKRIPEILEIIQDDGGQPGSPNVYARDLSKLLAYFEQRIDKLEGKQEDS
jgi:hypothetical protein